MGEAKTSISLRIDERLKDAVVREAEKRRRTASNLAEVLLGWAWGWYERAGSLDRLLDESSLRFYSRRISRDTQEQLYTALETAFERAPSSAIEKLAETITRLAGAPWDERAVSGVEPDYDRQAAAGEEALREDAAPPTRHRKGVAKR